jgi:SAM-dependent methyltransferase
MIRAVVSALKRIGAPLYIGLCSSRPIRDLIAPDLKKFGRCQYSPRGTGHSTEHSLQRLRKRNAIRGKDALVVGSQYGSEISLQWTKYDPRKIVAIDVITWPEQWSTISRLHPQIRFAGMDAMSLGFADSSFDLIYSQAVLEHITDVDRFFAESHRVLRKGGIFHADFGPLWHTFGGPHIGELQFDHLLLPWDEYLSKAKTIGNGWECWLVEGLFNRLRLEDYLEAFGKYFDIKFLFIIGSPEAEKFKKAHPVEWQALRSKHFESDLTVRLVSLTGVRR